MEQLEKTPTLTRRGFFGLIAAAYVGRKAPVTEWVMNTTGLDSLDLCRIEIFDQCTYTWKEFGMPIRMLEEESVIWTNLRRRKH